MQIYQICTYIPNDILLITFLEKVWNMKQDEKCYGARLQHGSAFDSIGSLKQNNEAF
jgi:hypothetical protein